MQLQEFGHKMSPFFLFLTLFKRFEAVNYWIKREKKDSGIRAARVVSECKTDKVVVGSQGMQNMYVGGSVSAPVVLATMLIRLCMDSISCACCLCRAVLLLLATLSCLSKESMAAI